MIRVFNALFISLALLSAQHSALSHQLWHIVGESALLADAAPDEDAHDSELLCDLHAALGTVVGGVDNSCVEAPLPGAAAEAFAAAASSPPCSAGPSPSARDPPPLL